MRYDLVIFDLDGTLLDTLDDLTDATNRALAEAGFPSHSREKIRTYIGNGVAKLIERAVPAGTDEQTRAQVLSRFKTIYTENVNVNTRPFPGVPELLRALGEKDVRAAVNSNKVDNAVQLLCDAHFPGLLQMALGERPNMPKKPAPDGARLIMEALGADPKRTLYVGDGDADLLTAQNAKIDAAWVSWGFRHRDELGDLTIPRAFDSAEQLAAFILRP